jgi:hypothetical protein
MPAALRIVDGVPPAVVDFFKKIKKRKKYFFCPAGGVLAANFLAPWQRASGMMTSCDRRLK